MNFIRLVYVPLYDGLIVWPHPEEEPTIVFEDGGDGNAFKLIENGLLAFDDVDELGNKDHRFDKDWLQIEGFCSNSSRASFGQVLLMDEISVM